MATSEAFAPAPEEGPVTAAQARAALGSPKEWARQYRRDADCELQANMLKKHHGEEVAWSYVSACVAKGNFTQLRALCENWAEELRTRPEAPTMLAQVIAARGGHIRADLEVIQQKRIGLFDLASALKQSIAFKGRYLVFVAKLAETKEKKGKIELVLLEQAMSSDSERVLAGAASGTVSSSSGSGSAAWRSNGFVGSGSASGSTSSSSMSASGVTETRVTDVFEDTGQEIIAKIKQADPFLKVDKNMVFLVRFDSALVGDTSQLSEGEEPQRTALVTLISYHDM